MPFDGCNCLLKLPSKRDGLRTEDQLVKFLPVIGVDIEAGADVLIDEDVIKDNDAWQRPIPKVVPEHCQWRSAGAVKDDVRLVGGGESTAFDNRDRITSSEGTKYCCERRFAASILSVNER